MTKTKYRVMVLLIEEEYEDGCDDPIEGSYDVLEETELAGTNFFDHYQEALSHFNEAVHTLEAD